MTRYHQDPPATRSTQAELRAKGCCAHVGRTLCGEPIVCAVIAGNELADAFLTHMSAYVLRVNGCLLAAGLCDRHVGNPMQDATPEIQARLDHFTARYVSITDDLPMLMVHVEDMQD